MERNPNAPPEALTVEDLVPGLEVAVHMEAATTPHIQYLLIASAPFDMPVQREKVGERGVWEPGTEPSVQVVDVDGRQSVWPLGDMGVAPHRSGHWSPNYTMRAQG